MKNGKSLVELAQEIQRQMEAKKDFIVPSKKIEVLADDSDMSLGFDLNEGKRFVGPVTEHGHNQIGEVCKIPAKYYDLMRHTNPKLLAENVRYWLNRNNERQMIRSLDGRVRAVLSDSYRRLDNFDLANSVLPMLHEAKADIVSCEITESRIYIKAVNYQVQAEVKSSLNVGEVVSAGVIVSNSEIGQGSLYVKPLVEVLSCKNGNVADKYRMRKYHTGARNQEIDLIQFSNETKTAEDKALWLKVRDLVKHSLNESLFLKIVTEMQASTKLTLSEPIKAVDAVAVEYAMNESEKTNVLIHLMKGGDLTSWGIGNAVTRMAQDVESYDRSTELEHIGFEMMSKKW